MATLIQVDGTVLEVLPKDGKRFTLDELQEHVGGYIELVRTNDNHDMYINEEGKLNGLPRNDKATSFVTLFPDDVIVGPAIILTVAESDACNSESEEDMKGTDDDNASE